MKRVFLQRLLVWVAFAAALLVPLTVQAAIVPTCEDVDSMLLRETALPSVNTDDAACAAPRGIDEVDAKVDAKVAAMCDARGASVIAPPRILPVADARIDMVRGCSALETGTPMIGPVPDDAAWSNGPVAAPPHAVLAANDLVPPAPSELGPAFPPVEGEERLGIHRSLDRPPC
jgi:hypothetical protein